jgi:tRNA (cytidine56-2'-O)-methyltransferase
MADAAADRGLPVDRERVVAGALLHDIGRSLAQDVRHASLGAALLREEGWDEAVVRIVERHTGAGIDAAEAAALKLPVKDYTPVTLEERIVAHADNLYSGDKRLSLEQLGAKYQAKRLPMAWIKIRKLHAGLTEELAVDLETLEPAELDLE